MTTPTTAWKLVPVVPDNTMASAWSRAFRDAPAGSGHAIAWDAAYAAMLAAAPSPPAEAGMDNGTEIIVIWLRQQDTKITHRAADLITRLSAERDEARARVTELEGELAHMQGVREQTDLLWPDGRDFRKGEG